MATCPRVEQGEFTSARINTYEARFQWFLGAAIALLVVEILWSSRTDGRDRQHAHTGAEGTIDAETKPMESNPRIKPDSLVDKVSPVRAPTFPEQTV